ncbi:MAG TPA: MBL fold metallo-hydrolase [Blastocatellia bacterium]|nr:MBL fold metallo-hydrolase [Blastocatellia bacterium]
MAITEIAPDVFQIVTYVPEADLQFNQFLIRDDEPLLFHTGMNVLFPAVHEAVASLIDPATLRWIGFSHFEADECGSLNQWLQLAPNAQAACSLVGAMVSVNDFAIRPAKGMTTGEVISTGKYRFRFLHTPHVPHCWEAGLMFEETNGTLLCSDLFHQCGVVEPSTTSDVIERARKTLVDYQAGPLANYMPYTKNTDGILQSLADLKPRTIAPMHGSAYVGDGERAIREFAVMMREVLG